MRGYALLILAIVLLGAAAHLYTYTGTPRAPQPRQTVSLDQLVKSINWTSLVHGRLEIYKNGKLVQVVDPDPFTKNIELFFTNLAFINGEIVPDTNLLPIDTSGLRQNIAPSPYTGTSGLLTGPGGSVTFYLSENSAPSDIWNQYALGSYVLAINQSTYEYGFNNTAAWFRVTGWIEAQSNYTIQSIYIVSHTRVGRYDSQTFRDFLLAIEPVSLNITQGDNVTITWYVVIETQYSTNQGYIMFLRNLAAMAMIKIIGESTLLASDGTVFTAKGLGIYYNNYQLCSSQTAITVFSPDPGGICKGIKSYYSSLKNAGYIYNVFYTDEITSINTIYTKYAWFVYGNPYKWIPVMEVSGLNVQNSNEVVASFVLPAG